jgi:hypothetical protein
MVSLTSGPHASIQSFVQSSCGAWGGDSGMATSVGPAAGAAPGAGATAAVGRLSLGLALASTLVHERLTGSKAATTATGERVGAEAALSILRRGCRPAASLRRAWAPALVGAAQGRPSLRVRRFPHAPHLVQQTTGRSESVFTRTWPRAANSGAPSSYPFPEQRWLARYLGTLLVVTKSLHTVQRQAPATCRQRWRWTLRASASVVGLGALPMLLGALGKQASAATTAFTTSGARLV